MAFVSRFSADAQTTVVYSTGFEASEGFNQEFTLIGQGNWVGTDSAGNGLVDGFFPGRGQQAYVGIFPLSGSNDVLNVWRPLNFDALAAGKALVKFSVSFTVFESTNGFHDCFRWSIYNTNNGGTRLFTVDFDGATTNINYLLDDDVFVSTPFTFEKNNITGGPPDYDLLVTMNFASNRWSAVLNDFPIIDSKPITTRGSALNLGDVDAVWFHRVAGSPGNNYMVFDDYRVTAEALSTAPFRLDPLGRLPNGSFSMRLTGENGRSYAFELSTNLAAWTALRTNIAVGGTIDFVDSGATNSWYRFYRARFVP